VNPSPPRAEWPSIEFPELGWLLTSSAFALAAIILRLPQSSSPLRFAVWILVLLAAIGVGLLLWIAAYGLRALQAVYLRVRWYPRLAQEYLAAATDLEREREHSGSVAGRLIALLAQGEATFEILDAHVVAEGVILRLGSVGGPSLEAGEVLALVDPVDATWVGECVVQELVGVEHRAAVRTVRNALWLGYVRQQAERHAALDTTVVAIRLP
jgi:hypothetical protein